jgi:hypothetical protein
MPVARGGRKAAPISSRAWDTTRIADDSFMSRAAD